MATINYYLKKRADELFIQYSSKERKYIAERITLIRSNMKTHFGKSVSQVLMFGSYARGTNLPRNADAKSDIDVLVVFDQSEGVMKPETYREWIRKYAKQFHPRTPVKKSHPSVILEMQKVMFDLVPARRQQGFWTTERYQIPDREAQWIDTDPKGFSAELAQKNTRYGSIIKPIIRLIKRWNAYKRYPYPPYELEQIIARMYFHGKSYEENFLSVVEQLPVRGMNRDRAAKVKTLQRNAEKIREHLRKDEQEKAIKVVKNILGITG